jgi:cytochrome d ubiquinol oxidase subunit II
MTEGIIAVLGIAVLLYVLLGGADFGAGMVEIITGKKGSDTISKAIAPVWEANHIWIILAVVILFNGFPLAYTVMSTYLHIPLLLVLIGIIIRGTAFTFRYYDVAEGNVRNYYSWFFRISSLLTPFFLGIVLGAIILGQIPGNTDGNFNELFIRPWLNSFSVSTGLFLVLLFGWIASVYLIGETNDENFTLFVRTSLVFLGLLMISGLGVFLAAEHSQLSLFRKFTETPLSIGCVVLATLLLPFLWKKIIQKNILWTRLLAGVITTCILIGWFAVQFPVLISRADGNHLTIWNTRAPDITMFYLLIALIVGIFIILPAFIYLFKVFKFGDDAVNK